MNRPALVATIVGSTVAVAVLDFCTSAELVASILFALPLALCSAQDSRSLLWGTAFSAVLLTVVAGGWGLDRVAPHDAWAAWINRALLTASLITLATFVQLKIARRRKGVDDVAQIRNIAVRKAAELHLAQMEGRYRGLLEAAPDAMALVSIAGEIVLVNRAAERRFGYRREDLVGRPLGTILLEVATVLSGVQPYAPDDVRSTVQDIGPAIELRARCQDGSELPVEITLSALRTGEGRLVAVAIRDITTRKATEARLAQIMQELNRSNEELGQFAYIASHDLQEPLRMVASYTQLLSRRYKGKLDSEADEFIAFAVDGASRMQRLIQDLLSYSRVGTEARSLQDTSSEQALTQATRNLGGAIEASGALITHDPLPAVVAHEGQLVQLFQNLVGNAIKYQNAGTPRVHISSVKGDGSNWLFSVTDNGLGIEPKYFQRIFGMFQRLHRREEFAGTGIGLAIDDFGTGYSSLSYLRRFQIDALKIDQSFVAEITADASNSSIVTAVISMARSLELRVVAEGVETPAQAAFLRAHDCDEAQGYYFSRPIPPRQFAGLLERDAALRSRIARA